MRKRTLKINLAEMGKDEIVQMLRDNNADVEEIMNILQALFDMFSTSLQCSRSILEYAELTHSGFLTQFIPVIAKKEGINERGVNELLSLLTTRSPSASNLH